MDLNNDRNSVGSHEDSSIQPNYDVPKHSIPPKEGPPQAPNKKAVGKRMVRLYIERLNWIILYEKLLFHFFAHAGFEELKVLKFRKLLSLVVRNFIFL